MSRNAVRVASSASARRRSPRAPDRPRRERSGYDASASATARTASGRNERADVKRADARAAQRVELRADRRRRRRATDACTWSRLGPSRRRPRRRAAPRRRRARAWRTSGRRMPAGGWCRPSRRPSCGHARQRATSARAAASTSSRISAEITAAIAAPVSRTRATFEPDAADRRARQRRRCGDGTNAAETDRQARVVFRRRREGRARADVVDQRGSAARASCGVPHESPMMPSRSARAQRRAGRARPRLPGQGERRRPGARGARRR